LLGDIEQEATGYVSNIWALSVLTRSDKRKDRVEISPEQSAAAAAEAEKLTEKTGKRTRVVGWYHSHPHITVHPSHVDVKTQALYQKYMDASFVGLIFSCFNKDQMLKGRVQAIAFQSVEANRQYFSSSITMTDADAPGGDGFGYVGVERPLNIIMGNPLMASALDKVVELQSILKSEETQSYYDAISATPHPIARLHSDAVYQKAICRLLEYGCAPLKISLCNHAQAASYKKS